MPIDKKARFRYKIINSCLTNKRKPRWTLLEIVTRIKQHDGQVTQRTIERDFQMMRYDEELGYFAAILYDRKNRTYSYEDPTYSINKFPIVPDDLYPLQIAINVLQQFKGLDFVKQFEGLFDKLANAIDQVDKPKANNIAMEQTPYYKGYEYFDIVSKASVDHQPIIITYEKFDGTRNDHVFHAYFMKGYENRWYVCGYSETRNDYRTLGLDRIENVQPAAVEFKENKAIIPQQYFEFALGVTLGDGPPEIIELWFSPFQAQYIKTQHLHHTQQTVSEADNGITITLKLIPNPELTKMILSYGADVKVIGPVSLRDKIKEAIKKMMGNYD